MGAGTGQVTRRARSCPCPRLLCPFRRLLRARGAADALEGGLDGEVVGGDDVGVGVGAAVGVDWPGEEVVKDGETLGLVAVAVQFVAGVPPGPVVVRGESSLAVGPARGDGFVVRDDRGEDGASAPCGSSGWRVSPASEFLTYPEIGSKSQTERAGSDESLDPGGAGVESFTQRARECAVVAERKDQAFCLHCDLCGISASSA